VKPSIDMKTMGPLFSGAIYGQMKRVVTEIEQTIGDEMVTTIQGIDNRTFKTQTPRARLMVRQARSRGAIVVDRSHLIYGPWLESGGSRSHLFSGYHAFEKTTRIIKPKVGDIADRAIQKHLIR
jgi:hypothetical protein